MRTEAELNRMHDTVVARFPGGMTAKQYRRVVLESADEDGRVYPHSIYVSGEPLAQHSLLIGMWFDGLLAHWDDGSGRPPQRQPTRYRITEKGRAELTTPPQPEPPHKGGRLILGQVPPENRPGHW